MKSPGTGLCYHTDKAYSDYEYEYISEIQIPVKR